MAFNPNEHIMQIGYKANAKDYLPVQWRLVWFREQCPEGTIETEMVHLDLDRPTEDEASVWSNDTKRMEKITKTGNGFVIFRATVKDGKGGLAVATKSEKAASFPDFIEKCETGAVGRALAMLGYGTQFTGDELAEHHHLADAPVDSAQSSTTRPQAQPTHPKSQTTQQNVTSLDGDAARNQRLKTLILRAVELNQIDKALSSDEKKAAFVKLTGDVCQANITALGQITLSRLDAVEAYLNGKDAA